jgi:hypothetical protein
MKTSLFLIAFLSSVLAKSQCPDSGLKIQSKDCEEPRGLAVVSLACNEIKVKWSGNQQMKYMLKATSTDGSSDNVAEAKTSHIVYESNGNCTAVIYVTEGASINWNVQTVCLIRGATVYSVPVTGAETYIPLCSKDKQLTTAASFQVYPNPSKGSLVINHTGTAEKNVLLNIFDINGKKVLTKYQKSMSGISNQYKLDLRNLPPGTYTIEMVNGAETKQSRFVLMRE